MLRATPVRAAPCDPAFRSASAAGPPTRRSLLAPCSQVAVGPTGASRRWSQCSGRPPPPHTQLAVSLPDDLLALPPPPALPPEARAAPPRSPLARSDGLESSPAHRRAPETPGPRPHASAP